MHTIRSLACSALAFLMPGLPAMASPIATEDFTAYDPASPWAAPTDAWSYVTGNTWSLVAGVDGNKMLRSSANPREGFGSAGQIYYRLDGLTNQPNRIVFDMQIPESGTVPAGGSATVIIGFSRTREMGSTPEGAFAITFPQEIDSQGLAKLGVSSIRVEPGGNTADNPIPAATVASMFDVTMPFRVEVEVDPSAETVRARVNGEPWSETVRLPFSWNEVKYFRIYQRLLQVDVKKIEFFE